MPAKKRREAAREPTIEARPAAKVRLIRVMVSSRSSGLFDGRPLGDFRRELRQVLEAEKLLAGEFLDVRIHEEAPSDGSISVLEWSKREVRRADLLLVLYNGCSGGIEVSQRGLGVCHEEYVSAQALGMTVLWVRLPEDAGSHAQHLDRDRHFQKDVASVRLPVVATTWERAIDEARRGVRAAVIDKFHVGNTASRSPYDRGAALQWSQVDYRTRRELMRTVVATTLGKAVDSKRPELSSVTVKGEEILAIADAVPGAMSIGAARELVGQPFLRDHEEARLLADRAGPVHVIACHRAITETQALHMLGTPDATVVRPAFGVYLADEIQKVQVLLLGECRDEYATRSRATEALNWLAEVGEDTRFLTRAKARTRIVQAIAKEQETPAR